MPAIGDKLKRSSIIPVLLFFPLIILITGDGATFLANQVLIAVDLNLSFEFLGLIVGLNYAVAGGLTFVFGYLADTKSRKWLLFSGGLIWAVAELLTMFSVNGAMLLVCRIIAAIGTGAQAPVTFSLLSDMFSSEKRSNSFAWWGIASMIGSIGGSAIALAFNKINFDLPEFANLDVPGKIAHLISLNLPEVAFWRYNYLLFGVLAIVLCFLVLLIKEPKRAAKEKVLENVLADEKVSYEHSYRIKRSDLKYIYTRKSNFWLIINFVDNVASGMLVTYLITYVTIEIGFSLNLSALSFTTLGALIPFLVILLGFGLLGQFYFAKRGDKKVKQGDPAGRVKLAVFTGVVHIPFLVLTFLFLPRAPTETTLGSFFNGTFQVDAVGFALMMILMGLLGGIGLAMSLGIAPNWYASLIDVNLPEHRGTMIATASFLDTLGRSLGAIVGGAISTAFMTSGDLLLQTYPFGMTLVFMFAVFGVISSVLWLPILKYCKQDFPEIQRILSERAAKFKAEAQGSRETP